MTERLYYTDAELLAFDAQVIGHHQNDPTLAILDRTAFYPTSGGQPHDTGTLNDIAVLEVIDGAAHIVHRLAAPLALGGVHGLVDRARRHDHMQQHTAQHLLSALAADRFGWRTTSVHFGPTTSTVELATASVTEAELQALEDLGNEIVAEARAVSVSFETSDDAVALGLRSPPPRAGELRIVTIAGLDRSACGGTHLQQTSAIGPIHLPGVERVRGSTRVTFLAGTRTLHHLRDLNAQVVRVAAAMGCAATELDSLLPRRLAELRDLKQRVEALESEVAADRVVRLAATTLAGPDGVRRIVIEENDPALRRAMAQSVAGLERVCFAAIGIAPAGIVIASSADSGIDAGALMKQLIAAYGGKGGGSPRVAQGNLAAESPVIRAALLSP